MGPTWVEDPQDASSSLHVVASGVTLVLPVNPVTRRSAHSACSMRPQPGTGVGQLVLAHVLVKTYKMHSHPDTGSQEQGSACTKRAGLFRDSEWGLWSQDGLGEGWSGRSPPAASLRSTMSPYSVLVERTTFWLLTGLNS